MLYSATLFKANLIKVPTHNFTDEVGLFRFVDKVWLVPQTQRYRYIFVSNKQVSTCKSELAALQQTAQKRSLLGSRNSHAQSQQDRLLLQKNEDTLAQQNDTLERARRTMMETETTALEMTEELGQNREKLISAHGRVREVTGMTGRARRILYSMNQRAMQQKAVLYAVSVGLVLGFFILLWAMWH